MAENYCGKNCEACGFKEQLNCSGCKTGPGRAFGGDCELANCCRERGHDTCGTCTQNNWCSKQQNVKTLAESRFQRQEWERAKREKLEKNVPILAKWLTIIFWLNIIAFIPGLMSNDLTKGLSALHQTGRVISLGFSLAIAAIYLAMGKVNRRYRVVAACAAVTVIVTFIQNLVTGGETPIWTLLISLPMAGLGLVYRYQLYSANSEVLVPVEYTLSEKWMRLWKWFVRLTVALIASILVALIFPIVGLLLAAVAAIGTAVISIVELVYLYRMMCAFRTYAKELAA